MISDKKPQLASILVKYRELNHFTQEFVAKKIGITRSAYTYYETGKTQPSMETLQLLKALLNIPSEEFFSPEERNGMLEFYDSEYHNYSEQSKPSPSPSKMGELTRDERELIANYRLANPMLKRRARNILDPEFAELKNRKQNN